MPPNDDSFEQALREYHEETWDPAEFADLRSVRHRGKGLQAADDRLNELNQAA
jgi:hypothetical protein